MSSPALGSLVAKSLVSAQARGPSLSYRLLDSTRRYAAERRQADPACGQALRRHAQRVLALFEQSEEEWNWREPADWTQRYLGRIADLRAALSWAFGEEGDPVLGIRLTVAAITLWSETSILSEAQARLESALALAKTIECDDLSKAKLACALGWSLFYARKLSNENESAWLDAIAFARRAKDHGVSAARAGRFRLLPVADRQCRACHNLSRGIRRTGRARPRLDGDIRRRQGAGLGPSSCR